jgi:16S rRNA (adenine(1408)-N(1))-methyltransferase
MLSCSMADRQTAWEEHVESIWGKCAPRIDTPALLGRLASYQDILIDIGTGDGRFVRHMAESQPSRFAIGVDSCRENLRSNSRRAPANALYLIASAQTLPRALEGLATHITINFPWGSLLSGLLAGDVTLLERLTLSMRPGALLEVRLNGGALAAQGWALEDGSRQVWKVLRGAGFDMCPAAALGPSELRACPTTWARRLAFGRDPRAQYLRGVAGVAR